MMPRRIPKRDMDVIAGALDKVRAKVGGMLDAPDVVKAARPEKSPLHRYFEWDDTEAAELYRVEQARCLIRLVVTTVPGAAEPVQAFVSLTTERGRGYRHIIDVLDDEDLQQQMLADALAELERWRDRYAQCRALVDLRKKVDVGIAKVRRTATGGLMKTEAVTSPG
ncbi:MAG TPA: hypothetical protein PLU44_16765 [Candidatus Krumholzibacteria bacterium]|nr:hypothetical protein [Candidatus Krumholzibacteria bacterium]